MQTHFQKKFTLRELETIVAAHLRATAPSKTKNFFGKSITK